MDYKFIDNKSKVLFIIFNSLDYGDKRFDFENYLNLFFKEKKNPSFLYLRDYYLQWYYKGVRGFSTNYENTFNNILKLKNDFKFSKIICMGSSAGGYASLYFGSKLNANYIISFSPQIELEKSISLYYNKFEKFQTFKLEKKLFFDLTNIINSNNNKIFIMWVNYSNYYGISKKENRSVFQNLNDEFSYKKISKNKYIKHYFLNGNHNIIAKIAIEEKILDKILLEIFQINNKNII